jgi:tRNA pseudouridine55 synthase
VHSLELIRFEPPELEIRVECGRGTYIRSIAHDLGEMLACGAHLSALTRTRVGPFGIEDAVGADDLEQGFEDGRWAERLLPLDYGLLVLPAVTLHIEDEKDIRHGQSVRLDGDRTETLGAVTHGMLCRGYAEVGTLVAILRYDAESEMWRPRKVFAEGG